MTTTHRRGENGAPSSGALVALRDGEFVERMMFRHPRGTECPRPVWRHEVLGRAAVEGRRLVVRYLIGGEWRTRLHLNERLNLCPDCGARGGGAKSIRGTYSDERSCGAACRNARGVSCDCRCAGENHGAGWGA